MRPRLLLVAGPLAVAMSCGDGPLAPVAATRGPTDRPATVFESGDVIQVSVRLTGCFSDSRFAFDLRVSGDSALVENFSGEGNLVSGWRFEPVATLTGPELTGLDRLLRAYHEPSESWCTGSESGTVRVIRDGLTVRTEQFMDSSCRWAHDSTGFNWGHVFKLRRPAA